MALVIGVLSLVLLVLWSRNRLRAGHTALVDLPLFKIPATATATWSRWW